MLKRRNIVRWGLVNILALLMSSAAFAQGVTITPIYDSAAPQPAPVAPPVETKRDINKDVEELGAIYAKYPDSVYSGYLELLIETKQYKLAEKVAERQKARNPQDWALHIALGKVYAWEGKYNKAKEQYDSTLLWINGDDLLTHRIAKAFLEAGVDDYAILAYQKATGMLNAPFFYSLPLARLYDKCGELDKAIDMLLIVIPGQAVNLENVKTLMLEMLGTDEDKLRQMQKALVRKLNEEPGNTYYAELLTWIYTQKNDWDGALVQIEAVDERNKEGGNRINDFGQLAIVAKQYETAAKAYSDIIAQGKEAPYYAEARSKWLSVAFTQLENDSVVKPEVVNGLVKQYDSLLVEYPKAYSTQTASEYARLEAQYAGDAPKAIGILQKALVMPDTRRNMAGQFKLQMGDYYLLAGQLWDASLTYSQVDKEFKQDVLGEDARFRNAKLAYYRGDFEWAQRQLSVLKASTSELIANDALFLSVQITENVEDSNYYPLQRFAYAGLLLFENKDNEAEALLDSINKAFPKHPLNDDIIMERAEIALKHHNYNKALAYLKEIYEKYGQDVLGDDAIFKMAEVYQDNLHDLAQARHYYEQLIIDYPGSTYVQTARQRLNELNNGAIP